MTDHDAELEQIARAAKELVPELTERLRRSGLGELEVRSGSLRVRVAANPAASGPATGGAKVVATSAGSAHPSSPSPEPAAVTSPSTRSTHGVTSPAVGFFAYADGLGPGLAVDKGDALGHVEMLGVRHDVRAPRSGSVRNLVIEAGEPVEYGQLLIELEPAG
ncbi:MAG TPA: biotin/lipoyl-containing protein [Candidatus Limnocylindria bacterium]|nr:biotin/lipoyl-containing protein [Candidatus Limnocylindria bacterium]